MSRCFLFVLDSLGIGEMPDAAKYGDKNCNTLKRISESRFFHIPNLIKMGIGNIDGVDYLEKTETPTASVARLAEESNGKDTVTGHWEMMGVVSQDPFPTFPDGFPDEIIEKIKKITGRNVLCNKPYSGTEVIKDYGKEHVDTGALIVYTSQDSVLQIAAHRDVVPLETLYAYCKKIRAELVGKYGVGRVIARPFSGEYPNYTRLPYRRDYAVGPIGKTVLDSLKENGNDVIGVGKIGDIFAQRGLTESIVTHGNAGGMTTALTYADVNFNGLCFVNLVDFDTLYGHRQDVGGYARALSEFDAFLPRFMNKMKKDDVLIITADHGCDPGDEGTDHTREFVPFLLYKNDVGPRLNLGTINGFSMISDLLVQMFNLSTCKHSVNTDDSE